VKTLRLFATGLLTVAVAACTAQGQDILEDVTDGASSSSTSSAQTAATQERTLSGGTLEIGSSSADVTLRLYVNHDSPYSKQFHAFLPLLQEDYVSKGTVKLQIIPVAFKKYPQSDRHARMFVCAEAQGKGWAMHSLLMSGTDTLVPVGIDRTRYEACLQDAGTTAAVASLAAVAKEEEVTVVPTYEINGERFTGVPTEADLRGVIDANL